MRKRPAGPGTILFYAIFLTLVTIGSLVSPNPVPVWCKLLFAVLAVHTWYQFFKMRRRK